MYLKVENDGIYEINYVRLEGAERKYVNNLKNPWPSDIELTNLCCIYVNCKGFDIYLYSTKPESDSYLYDFINENFNSDYVDLFSLCLSGFEVGVY